MRVRLRVCSRLRGNAVVWLRAPARCSFKVTVRRTWRGKRRRDDASSVPKNRRKIVEVDAKLIHPVRRASHRKTGRDAFRTASPCQNDGDRLAGRRRKRDDEPLDEIKGKGNETHQGTGSCPPCGGRRPRRAAVRANQSCSWRSQLEKPHRASQSR